MGINWYLDLWLAKNNLTHVERYPVHNKIKVNIKLFTLIKKKKFGLNTLERQNILFLKTFTICLIILYDTKACHDL